MIVRKRRDLIDPHPIPGPRVLVEVCIANLVNFSCISARTQEGVKTFHDGLFMSHYSL